MAEATVRKFVSVKPIAGDDDLGKQIRSLNVAYNRMGGALTSIGASLQNFAGLVKFHGEFLKDTHERLVDQMKDHAAESAVAQKDVLGKQSREKGRKEDAKAEEDQEKQKKEGEKVGKETDKKEVSWLEKFLKPLAPIFGFLGSLVRTFMIYNFLDFLSKPENLDKVITFLKVIKGIWSFTRKISMWGVNQLLDGITRVFGTNPEKGGLARIFDGMFGVLQIMGGLAALYLASRIFMPWKLIGDVKFMMGLGKALNAAEKTSSGCGPDGKKPKGSRVGKDGRTAQQRLKDIRKLKRQRKINALNKKIADAQKVAARNIKTAALNSKLAASEAKRVASRAAREIAEESAKRYAQRQAARQAAGLTGEAAEGLTRRAADSVTDGATAAAQTTKPKSALSSFGDWVGDRVRDGKSKLINFKDRVTTFASTTWDFGKGQLNRLQKWWGANSKAFMNAAKQAGGNAWEWGKSQAKSLGNIAEMAKDPKKLGALVTDKIKQNLKPVVEKNPQVKQLMEVARNPGKMKDPLIKMVQSGFKNPGIKSFRDFLNAAKSNAKVGGVDKVVATILALVDYGLFGESPINALLKALGGLLGYSAGFAIGAPFGGVPGFITGVAGGFAGEWIADRILEQLYKLPGLKDKQDPVAKALFGSSPYANRKIIRDPNQVQPWEANAFTAAQGEKPAEMAKGGSVKRVSRMGMGEPPLSYYEEQEEKAAEQKAKRGYSKGGLLATNGSVADVRLTPSTPFSKYPLHHNKPDTDPYNRKRLGGLPVVPRDYVAVRDFNNQSKDRGTPVVAGVDGKITYAGGHTVVISKGGKDRMQFHHFDRIKAAVGQTVGPKDIIGYQGNKPGGSVHVHLDATPSDHRSFAANQLGSNFDSTTMTETGVSGGGGDGDANATGAGGETPAEEPPPQDPFEAALANLESILNKHLPDTKAVPSGWAGEQAPAGSTTPTPASTTPTQADQLNKKTEKLEDLSKSKVARDKDGKTKTNTELLMLQQNIIQPSSASTSQQVYYGSVSPLVLGK